MLSVDFHSHTFFSLCGIHTHLELLNRAAQLGIQGLAITDHGSALDSRNTPPFYDRLTRDVVPGVTLLKGIECNVLDEKGNIDIPINKLKYLDIVLLGLHPNIEQGKSKDFYTQLLCNAMRKNPWVDMITHPNELEYPIDFEEVAEVAKNEGIMLELNNSKTMYNRTTHECTLALVNTCKKVGCLLGIGSDTHAIHELGDDTFALPYLKETGFPEELWINSNAKKAFSYLDKRRERKN